MATLNRTGGFTDVQATAFDKNGNLWVADFDGVYEFSKAQLATISGPTSLKPFKSFTVRGMARSLAFYLVPVNLPIYK